MFLAYMIDNFGKYWMLKWVYIMLKSSEFHVVELSFGLGGVFDLTGGRIC